MATGMRMTEAEARVIIDRLNRTAGRAPGVTRVDAEILAISPKKGRAKAGPSELELAFAKQISVLDLPAPQREYKFHPQRDWRLDYAWPEKKLAVEVQGMVHRIRTRFLSDVEKLAMAQIHGWRVLLVAGRDVRSGRAASWLVTLWEMSK